MSRALVERAADGDHDAFAELAAGAIDRLHALARLILRDADAAEDAAQDALVRAWQELHRLRDPDRFDAWLRRLLVNACYDESRRRGRRPTVHLLALGDVAAVTDDQRRIEDRDRLGGAFARLPVEQRAVLVLQHYVGLPDTEIATTLGLPLGTVKSRLRYAVRAMRASLDADERTARGLTGERMS